MKKIIILLLIIAFTSCEDFLQEDPKDRLTEVGFYNTPQDARAAVDAAYGPLRGIFRTMYMWMTDCHAEYAYGRGSLQPTGGYQGFDPLNAQRAQTIWNGFYGSIRNSNIAIERIPGIDMAEAAKTELIAEARFMRAFAHYHLVKKWGPVPLHLQLMNDDTGRKPVAEVYQAIITDLQFAETNLPPRPARLGNPSIWSAKALLAEVHLNKGDWQSAKVKSKEIIDSEEFALVDVGVLDDFDNIFGPDASGSVEEIFYIKYNHEDGWSYPMNLLWETTEWGPYGNWIVFARPMPFYDNWDDNDLRKQWNVFTEYINRHTGELETLPSAVPILFSKYRDPDAPTRTGYANDFPRLRYADVLLIYSEAAVKADNAVDPLAVECLNKIRRRGYGHPWRSPSPVDYPADGWTVEEFLDVVLQERAYELFMEAKRWDDLKRAGTEKLREIILLNTGKTVHERHLLWPIPQTEIDTNPQIDQADQNPGY